MTSFHEQSNRSARAIRKTALRANRGCATVLLINGRSAHAPVCLPIHASMIGLRIMGMAELLTVKIFTKK